MADAPVSQGPNLHALGLLDNKGGSGGGGGGGGGGAQGRDLTNEQIGTHDTARFVHIVAITAGVADFLGINIGGIFGHGGMFQGMETQGLAGKNINSIMDQTNMRGGFIANLMHSVFMKNLNEIKDQTGGIAAGGHIEGPQIAAASNSATFAQLSGSAGGGHHFESANMSMASLGNLQPMNTPIISGGRGAGMIA